MMARWFVPLGVGAIGIGAAFLLLFAKHSAAAPSAPPSPAVVSNGTPILVELFTSEGCSSCPPADDVATRLERSQPVAGARVVVLAHHVDYWDSLGWPDPWSSSAATARQRSYNRGSYTPQAVIDGRVDVVGSRGDAVEAAIVDAAKVAHLKVAVDVTPVSNAFDVSVRSDALPADAETLIAVVQDRGRVDVPRGENAGKTLAHTSIVRSLVTSAHARVTVPSAIAAPEGTTFSVVAFVQDRASRRILGASGATLMR